MAKAPSPGQITSKYGWRKHPVTGVRKFHEGTDYGWGNGDIVTAPESGEIVSYGVRGGYGRLLVIKGDSGTEHRLAHLSRAFVTRGRVSEGQDVAVQGDTGNVAGKHLHWETWVDSGTVDPEQWLIDHQSPSKAKDEDMAIAILEIRGDSDATKSLYDVNAGKAIRAISRDENASFRVASPAAVVYVSVSRDEYKKRGGK